jgi:hypothetical protein
MNMPQINLEPISQELIAMRFQWTNTITDETRAINGLFTARQIIATRGKNAGSLRASKPPMARSIVTRTRSICGIESTHNYYDHPLSDCAAAQVWRYVAFEISPLSHHQCLPVTADFDSPFDMDRDESRQFAKWCQSIADVILAQFKPEDKPGLMRWARLV